MTIRSHFKKLAPTLLALATLALLPGLAAAERSPRAMLYLDGETVRTFVVPAYVPPGSGTDPLFMVTNGVQGQLGIAGVGPGHPGYHGGRWAVYLVTFNAGETPYLLTSDEAVEAAEAAGDVTVTRAPAMDNRCPVQP
jgi:hypothetical protein